MVYKINVLNQICSEKLGGVGNHVFNIYALNEWCTLQGGTGGHKYEIEAYNELSTLYGGTGGHKYDIDALNEISVLLGGSGGYVYSVDALIDISSNVNQSWYGIERDNTIASPDWTRIASSQDAMSLHASLPVHQLFRPCVLLPGTKTVKYYLLPTDLTKKADGTVADLTGAAGNVMSHQTASYWKLTEKVGNIERIKISANRQTAAGWVEIPAQFYSVYEGKLVGSKLSSISGVLPTNLRSETQFRADARANGDGYEQQWLKPYTELVHLFMIQFATLNFQKAVDYTLTAEGFSKGGLGIGVTSAVLSEWSAFNGLNPFISSGSCNTLAKHWGEKSVVIPNFGGAGVNRTFTTNRFLFVENIFGHIWKWTDGVTINHLADRSEAYVFDNPSDFIDNSSTNGRLAGLLPMSEGWIKSSLFPEILPATVGGSSTTQYCDYFYRPAAGSGWRALLLGNTALYNQFDGAFTAFARNAAALGDAIVGARLHVK